MDARVGAPSGVTICFSGKLGAHGWSMPGHKLRKGIVIHNLAEKASSLMWEQALKESRQ